MLFSSAEGTRSLRDRENLETSVVKADQEGQPSRFSSLRQAAVKFNSSQEANAMVLAKWAEDTNLVVASTSVARGNPGREQNSTPPNKTGMWCWCSLVSALVYRCFNRCHPGSKIFFS